MNLQCSSLRGLASELAPSLKSTFQHQTEDRVKPSERRPSFMKKSMMENEEQNEDHRNRHP